MTTTKYPDPKDAWAVTNVRGVWTATKTARGTYTVTEAQARAEAKNAATARNRGRFRRNA